jgi:hypothetical protein
VKWQNGRRYTLGDPVKLAAALQEVLRRPGWAAGNDVSVIVYGPAQPAWARIKVRSFDSAAAPRLVVKYEVPQPSSTPTATSTRVSPTATNTAAPPTATSSPTSGAATPVAGQPCPASVHDKYVAQGPDGQWYATWHPPVDPQSGCVFGHEHGDNPATSNANSSPPLFGYAAAQAGMNEPHVGFKVAVLNRGAVSEGKTLNDNYRVVLHMGTAGVGRYTQPMHSIQYDFVSGDGSRWFHIYGIADTGNGKGATCTNPRDGGKDFSTTTCPDTYEIWNSVFFKLIDPERPYTDAMHVILYASFSMAAFDPITTQNPADLSAVIYTQAVKGNPAIDPTSPQAQFRGCDRETYGGPNYWDNGGGSITYYTDAYGKLVDGPGPGIIEQRVSKSKSTSGEVFKLRSNTCHPTTHAPN